jgi:chemotaxis protein MotB
MSEPTEDIPWLSFSDVVTALLFVFIATTFWFMLKLEQARQRTDAEYAKWRAADTQAGELLNSVAVCLKESSGSRIRVRPVVEVGARTLSVYLEPVVSQTVVEWFPNCGAEIGSSADEAVGQVRSCLSEAVPELVGQYEVSLTLEGHTDNRQPGLGCSFPSNWELSGARAGAVLRRLLCEDGSCESVEVREKADILKKLTVRREDLQIIAAGRAASVPAWRAICDPEWVGASLESDREVCELLEQREKASGAERAIVEEKLRAVIGGELESVDKALVFWANPVQCMTMGEEGVCRDRLGRLRRVDMRVDLRPKFGR